MDFLHEDLTTLENITPFLKQCLGKGKDIPLGSILQVQQISNVSFPTYEKPSYNSDKHSLKVTVTDGKNEGNALVPDSCPGLDLNTPPGTKLKTTQPVPIHGSLLILTRNNCEVLGGRVPRLYEKWDAQKKHAIKHEWGYTGTSIEGEGPPPWRPFGYKSSLDVAALRKMKTTDVSSDAKNGQAGAAKSEFEMQRDEAVSELLASANKQKFQKPNKHLLDKEITDIMDEGFSQSDAEYAMNRFKNTQKALKFLKESKAVKDGVAPKEPPKPPPERKDRRRKGKGRNDEDEEQDVPAEYQRPTRSISLFGFIEGQIKTDTKSSTDHSNGPSQTQTGGGRGRDRDLEDGFGRLNLRDSNKGDSYMGGGRGSYSGRGGGRGGRGFSSRGGRGGGSDRGGGSYHSQTTPRYEKYSDNSGSQHYENSGREQRHESNSRYDNSSSSTQRFDSNNQTRYDNSTRGTTQPERRPPRFQNRGEPDGRSSDYSTGSRNYSSGGGRGSYDDYRDRGPAKESYDGHSSYYDPPSSSSNRQEYSGSYQSQPQQEQHQRQPHSGGGGKDRGYSSDYGMQQQQYPKSNDYNTVPSQSYSQQSYHQQQQRQYGNQQSSQNHHDNMGHRNTGQRPPHHQSHFSNHSSVDRGGGHSANQQQQQNPGEFQRYQYGYEGYNPSQSLVFTRSKSDAGGGRGGGTGDGRTGGRGGYQGQGNNGRGGNAQQQSNPYGRPNNRY